MAKWQLWRKGEARQCVDPRVVRLVGLVECGQCVNCAKQRIHRWIGRMMAEGLTCQFGLFATLTIGGDQLYQRVSGENLLANRFEPDEVREYIKRFRSFLDYEWQRASKTEAGLRVYLAHNQLSEVPASKPKLRYFVVGENGDQYGRCHYHLLMFFYGCRGLVDFPPLDRFMWHGKYPDGVVVNARLADGPPVWEAGKRVRGIDYYPSAKTFWPHGIVKYRELLPEHAYYVGPYIAKALGVEVMRPGISRRPVLGAFFFENLARQYVEQGLSPQKRVFSLPRNEGYTGFNPEYWMTDASLRHLCRAFVRLWREAWLADPVGRDEEYPYSELVDAYVAWQDAEDARKTNVRLGVRPVHDQLVDAFAAREARERRRHWEGIPFNVDDVACEPAARTNEELRRMLSGEKPLSTDYRKAKSGE